MVTLYNGLFRSRFVNEFHFYCKSSIIVNITHDVVGSSYEICSDMLCVEYRYAFISPRGVKVRDH